jgi:hypothetical protein
MFNKFLDKIKRAPWVIFQPLTKTPKTYRSVTSDLFLWRCNDNWNTYFELLDIAGLFGDKDNHKIDIIFFDNNGIKFHQELISLFGFKRQRLDISKLLFSLNKLPSEYGLFCIFHKKTPNTVSQTGSFIAERGYSSYQYKNAPLSSYVHGNIDAIDSSMKLLGGTSFYNRNYNLQYLFEPKKSYEICLINPSEKIKKIEFSLENPISKMKSIQKIKLKPLEIFMMPIKDLNNECFVSIRSKMIMARPLVFCFENENFDVFHG